MQEARPTTRITSSGLTLLEVLFAVLIVAMLAALAIPLYVNSRAQSQSDACRDNVRAIATVESNYRFENAQYTAAGTALTTGYGLAESPKCPAGGASGAYGITVNSSTGECAITCGYHSASTIVLAGSNSGTDANGSGSVGGSQGNGNQGNGNQRNGY